MRRSHNGSILRIVAVMLLVSWGVSCSTRPPVRSKPIYEAVGLASYYGKKFHGRRTASGERYDMHAMTAAHKSLAFGAIIRVTHLKNGRSVKVRINDRGPFVKGRIIDLSYAAAKELKMLTAGVAQVKISVERN